MGSDGSFGFPVIDFSDPGLRPGTFTWDLVKSQVLNAAKEYGCFQALFNKIPEELHKAMNEAWEELFQLPSETKKCNVPKKPFQGYHGSSMPAYESLGITEPDIYNNVENFTNVLWAEGNTKVSKTLYSFSERLVEFDKMIRRIIVESLGVEKYLEEHMNSTSYCFKVHKYQAPSLGLKAHADKNVLTILYQNQVDGLEIQTKNGDWIPIKFSPDSFFIIIGESLNAWLNARLYSPYHRVAMAGNKRRYSAVLFSIPEESCQIKAIEELVDEDHPLQYKPFGYGEYLKCPLELDSNMTSIRPLKDYFGV